MQTYPSTTARLLFTAVLLFGAAGLQAQEAAQTASGEEGPGPLELAAIASRAALEQAGLERVEVDAGGGRMVLWRGGSGPDMVLLHGAGQQAGAWAFVVPGLVDEYTVHALDLPGHGDSDPSEGVLTMARIFGGLEAYLDTLPGEAILVGNSMGGWLATLEAHRHPERVSRALLVNGGALLNVPAEGLTLMPADREAARRTMAAIRDPSSPPIPDVVLDDIVKQSASGPIGRMMQDMPGLMAHLLEGRLGEVEVPVEIIWGASDGLMPLDYARRMESQLPRARLTVIEACGHIVPSECPNRLLTTLHEVLAMEPPEPKPMEPEPEPPAEATEGSGEATR